MQEGSWFGDNQICTFTQVEFFKRGSKVRTDKQGVWFSICWIRKITFIYTNNIYLHKLNYANCMSIILTLNKLTPWLPGFRFRNCWTSEIHTVHELKMKLSLIHDTVSTQITPYFSGFCCTYIIFLIIYILLLNSNFTTFFLLFRNHFSIS